MKHYMDNPDAVATHAQGPAAEERAAAERIAEENRTLEEIQQMEAEEEQVLDKSNRGKT